MNITLKVAALAVAATLAACGGGSDSNSNSAPAVSKKLSFYGLPRVAATTPATAKVQAVAHAELPGATETTNALQAALVAKGVPATVTPTVMDGTTLHALVATGLPQFPPTSTQFAMDQGEWLIVNFVLDDMVTDINSEAQQAAIATFKADLTTFIQRAGASGKRVFIIPPTPNCLGDQAFSAWFNLAYAENQVGEVAGLMTDSSLPADWKTHLGADCKTPDQTIIDLQTTRIADYIGTRYQFALQGK